ncbi:MAG: hypothetical protein AVDCRST_MAG50-1248, partial [uncultured Acidimicrobiales bacterium]
DRSDRPGAGHLPGSARGGGEAVRRPRGPLVPGARQALRDDQRGRHQPHVQGRAGCAAVARRRPAPPVLRAAVRGPPWVDRRPPRRRPGLGRDGRADRGQLSPHCAEAALRSDRSRL